MAKCSPECEVCRGIGYVRDDLPYGHPKFGKIYPCPNIEASQLYPEKRCGLSPNEIQMLSWNQVKDIEGQIADKAMKATQAVLQKGYGWVFLHGGPGLAKTLILKIAVAAYLRVNKEASYQRMSGILDNLRAAYDTEAGSSEATMRLYRWTELPLLSIDEFDRVRDTAYAQEKKFDLLDARYERAVRKDSITLMASNKPPSSFGDYLYDRIRDGRFEVIELTGASLRPGMEWD